jgi:hypothetical protein
VEVFKERIAQKKVFFGHFRDVQGDREHFMDRSGRTTRRLWRAKPATSRDTPWRAKLSLSIGCEVL